MGIFCFKEPKWDLGENITLCEPAKMDLPSMNFRLLCWDRRSRDCKDYSLISMGKNCHITTYGVKKVQKARLVSSRGGGEGLEPKNKFIGPLLKNLNFRVEMLFWISSLYWSIICDWFVYVESLVCHVKLLSYLLQGECIGVTWGFA